MKRRAKEAKLPLQWRWQDLLPQASALWGITLVAFFSIVHFGFVSWDDGGNFIFNPWVKHFGNASSWNWAWSTNLTGVYQPVSWIFIQLQYALSPSNPAAGIHAASLLLHLANATIVYTLCLMLIKADEPSAKTAALCGAIYFALQPLQCETIAWASCQPYLLAGFFGGLSLFCFLKSLEPAANRVWYRVSVGLFAISLLSKSSLVSFPAILFILRLSHSRGPLKSIFKTIRRDWPFWFLSFCGLCLALWARSGYSGETVKPLSDTIPLAPAFLGFFLGKTIYPAGLSVIYDPSLATGLPILLGLSFVAAMLACLLKEQTRTVGLFLLALTVLLSPGIAATMTEGTLFADRYAYVPNAVMGLFFAQIIASIVVFMARRFPQLKAPPWLVPSLLALTLCLALGLSSRKQVSYWSDSVNLWQHAIQNGGAMSCTAQNNLGVALADQGRYEEALPYFQRALELKPEYVDAHNNLANALAARGQLDEAIVHYRKSLDLNPENVDAHNNIGIALARRGQLDDAIAHYRKALEIRPDLAEIHNSLGAALFEKGLVDEAITQYQKALEIDPGHVRARQNLEGAKRTQESGRVPAGH